jgi:hypothetical protein
LLGGLPMPNQLHIANNTALFLPPMNGNTTNTLGGPMSAGGANNGDPASQKGPAGGNLKSKRSGGSRNTPLTGAT